MPLPSALLLAALTAAPADTVPLFASETPLELTLEADFGALRGDHADEPAERPGRLILDDGRALDVQLRPRGHFRRDPSFCSLPPLRLNLRKGQVEETVFAGQDKLKLVVPCRPERAGYEEYVLREYLLYRVYALVTDVSFRTRLARITFRDAEGDDAPFARWVFLIESDEALAARVGGQLLDIPEGKNVRTELLHPEGSTRVAVFQYMIGNTDWADARVHNVAIVAVRGRIVPVPYDFDFAGAVGAPYAIPSPEAPIRTVEQRFYQGWCWPGLDAEAVLGPFREARPAVEDVVRGFTPLAEASRDALLDYLGGFWDAIATPERAERRLFRDCRTLG